MKMDEPTKKTPGNSLETKVREETTRSPTFLCLNPEYGTTVDSIEFSVKSEIDEERYLHLLETKRRDEEARSPSFLHMDPQPPARVSRLPKALLPMFNKGDTTECPSPCQSELISSSETETTVDNLPNASNVSDFDKDFLPLSSFASVSSVINQTPAATNVTSSKPSGSRVISSKLAEMKKVFLDESMKADAAAGRQNCSKCLHSMTTSELPAETKASGKLELDLGMLDEFKGLATLRDVVEAGKKRRLVKELERLSIEDQNLPEVPDVRFLWDNKKKR